MCQTENEKKSAMSHVLVQYSRTLKIHLRCSARTIPKVADSKYNIAGLHEEQGQVEEAKKLFLECEQIYAKVHGQDHSDTLDAARRAQTVGLESGDDGEEEEEGEEEDELQE